MSTDPHFCKFCREVICKDGYSEWLHELTGKYIARNSKGVEHMATPGGKSPKKDK